MTTVEWLQVHRTIGRFLNRIPPVRQWIARRVWADLETDPAFVRGMEAGLADLEAGRFVKWEDVR